MPNNNNTLYILYGSATGNAEHIAKDLASKPPPPPFTDVKCDAMEKFKKYSNEWLQQPTGSLSKHGIIIITSTTGNGDAPENASRFVRYLKRKSTAELQPFQHVAFAVLGLGDSNYDQFCATGKAVDKKMSDLGGMRAMQLAMADEATGLEDVVEPFIDSVFDKIVKACTKQEEETGEPKDEADETVEPKAVEPAPVEVPSITEQPVPSKTNNDPLPPGVKQAVVSNGTAVAAAPPSAVSPPLATIKPSSSVSGAPANTPNGSSPGAPAKPAASIQPPPTPVSQTTAAPPSKLSSSSPLFILYGSATGNSEHIAKDLASTYQTLLQNPLANCFFPKVICCEMDQFKKLKCLEIWQEELSSGSKHGVLIVTSTTGNGDAPENASRFVRYLKRKTTIAQQPFQNCAFAVLGLGDTNYDNFCATGKLVDRKLAELGGTRVQPLAEADEGTGCLEEVVEPWKANILLKMTEACRGGGITGDGVVDNDRDNVEDDTATHTPPVLNTRTDSIASTEQEEKKSEDKVATTAVSPAVVSKSRGVQSVRALLGLDDESCNAEIPTVDHACLPSLGSSLSSCQLIHEEEELPGERRRSRGMSLNLAELDHMTISTSSSTAIHYTINRPYETSILAARYLTNTKTNAAKAVCEELKGNDFSDDDTMMKAMEIYENHFPLEQPVNGDKNAEHAEADEDVYERNGKRVIEMTLALPDDYTLEYKPGDSLGLVVPNTPQAVRFVLRMLRQHHNIEPTQKVSVDSNHPITVEEAVRHYIDLNSPLKSKRILHSLSQFAAEPDEECVLRLLSSKTPKGEDLFAQYVDGQRLSVMDILQDFPSCQGIPLEGLLGILPGIPPRYYSVSSSPLDKQREALSLTVAFSVVDYMTPSLPDNLGNRRVGGVATRYLEVLCSAFLSGNKVDVNNVPKLKVFPKPTAEFRLPATLSTPLVLIGPGTGIAPFMGFLAHRKSQIMESTDAANSVVEGTWRGDYELEAHELPLSKSDAKGLNLGVDYRTNQNVGPVDVYFGCRHQDHDWLYRHEMEQYRDEGVITHLHTAFSRDGPERCYVQDLMKNDSTELAKLILEQNASVYVCGDGNAMGKDVQSAIVNLIAQQRDGNIDEAKEYLEKMKVHQRFVLDIWTS